MSESIVPVDSASSPQLISSLPGTPGPVLQVQTDKLEDNRFKLRIAIEPAALQILAATLEAQGLQQFPCARPIPETDRYELLSGHRRVKAFRLLRDKAQTPAEREKYSVIPVRVFTGVDDRAAFQWSLTENAARVDLNPLEWSEAIVQYMKTTGEEPEAIARNLPVLTEAKVKDLVLLASSLDFIKAACGYGLGEDLPAKVAGEERDSLQRRRLDLSAAIEFQRAYGHLSRHSKESDSKIRLKVQRLVRQALLEDWSCRDVKVACRELTGRRHRSPAVKTEHTANEGEGRTGLEPKESAAPESPAFAFDAGNTPAVERPAVEEEGFEWVGEDLVIHMGKFDTLGETARDHMRSVLNDLLKHL